MYVDALTLGAVAAELTTTISGGRIQRAILPSPTSIALEIYAAHRRHYLVISAHPRYARIHLTANKPSRGVGSATPLLLLLRKYVAGGRIERVEQPTLERIIALSIAKRPLERNTDDTTEIDADWDDEMRHCELIVEIMDRRSNIILVGDDNVILESVRHVTPRMSRRPVVPREPYEPPPPQEKHDPRLATAALVEQALSNHTIGAERALVGAFRALSPLAAREVLFRAIGSTRVEPGTSVPYARIATELQRLFAEGARPCLAYTSEEPTAFAPYLLTHLPTVVAQSSMCQALDSYFAAFERISAHAQRRDALRDELGDTRERLVRQRSALETELAHAEDMERLRWEGEMIFGYLHTLVRGQTELHVGERSISLNPRLSGIENAQERFKAYDKAKGAMQGVPGRLKAVNERIAGLDETLTLLMLADGYDQIEAIAREATDDGYLRESPQTRKRATKIPPLRVNSSDGYVIYVGRSAAQNEIVTFKLGTPADLWLHVRGMPGAHVLLKTEGRDPPPQTLREAAALAAYFSSAREEPAVEVDITRRSQVRRIRDGPTGLVSYHAEQSLRVAPQAPW